MKHASEFACAKESDVDMKDVDANCVLAFLESGNQRGAQRLGKRAEGSQCASRVAPGCDRTNEIGRAHV